MGAVTRVLCGLEDFEVTGAVERAGMLKVSVRLARPDAACPGCGTFSARVKEYRIQWVRDGLSYERPTVLVWAKRRFRCDTPGCVRTFTESAAQVGPRRRVTARLCRAIAAARQKIAALPKCPPRHLGNDETTFRRHRSFMTGLVDLDTARMWDLIERCSKKVLVTRLEALGDAVRSIEAVVIDLYAGYKAAVRDLAPHAARVADRFRIQRLAD